MELDKVTAWMGFLRDRVQGDPEDYLRKHLKGYVSIDGKDLDHNLITNLGFKSMVYGLYHPVATASGQVVRSFEFQDFKASTSETTVYEAMTEIDGTVHSRFVEQVDVINTTLVCSMFLGTPEFNFTWYTVGLTLRKQVNGKPVLFCAKNVTEDKTSQKSLAVTWSFVLGAA